VRVFRKVLVVLVVLVASFAVLQSPAADAQTSSQTAELQRWLTAKGFFRDRIDGTYGPRTAQAVMAFRKEIGVARSFSWSDSLWPRLKAYERPYTRFYEANRVEVNLSRQVMYLFRNHALEGIFPIASGNGETYLNSFGDPVQAITPTGSYRFYLHRDPAATGGWHTSYLGSLYKPWYFSGGYAIHGSTSVPAEPASHGCVRLTTWDADWLQSRLYIGMPIHIWYEPSGAGPSMMPSDTIMFQYEGGRYELWSNPTPSHTVRTFFYGDIGDVPFSGDWNGNGEATPGLYRQSTGQVYLRNSNSTGIADRTFFFGDIGDIPLSGDFNGNGFDTVSVYRPSEARIYVINRLGPNGGGLGFADYSFQFGDIGDVPFVGDFDGDGIDTIGVYRPSTGMVYLRNSNTSGPAHWTYVYGESGDWLFAGDWDGDGIATMAAFRPSDSVLYVRNRHGYGVADYAVAVPEGVLAAIPMGR
jgi:peptidoglycan hydrolase-like protein with peptidoglycan-binding domain